MVRLPAKLRVADPMQQQKIIQQPYEFAAIAVMLATFLVALYYCLECLHAERRDRSILFWKSLPVSDLTTVLAKASIPIVILPLLDFVLTVIGHCVMVVIHSVVLGASGFGSSGAWTGLHLSTLWVMLLYHLVAIHALWFAPFYSWMLLVSSWARRAVLLWATVPLLALGILESIAFTNSSVLKLFTYRITGSPQGVPFSDGNMAMNHSMHVLPFWQFLLSPGLWFGLLVTAGFLFAATRIRRTRGPI
jgi:ABC-2 type transport system permease protein